MYDLFAPLVRSICFERTGDWHATWDVAHDVFLVAMRTLDRLEAAERFQPWLLAIARNKLADFHRRRERRSAGDIADVPPAQLTFEPGELEAQRMLRDCIADLPENLRVAVRMFYLEGASAKAIAQATNIPLRTVYASLETARAVLKERLNRDSEVTHHD